MLHHTSAFYCKLRCICGVTYSKTPLLRCKVRCWCSWTWVVFANAGRCQASWWLELPVHSINWTLSLSCSKYGTAPLTKGNASFSPSNLSTRIPVFTSHHFGTIDSSVETDFVHAMNAFWKTLILSAYAAHFWSQFIKPKPFNALNFPRWSAWLLISHQQRFWRCVLYVICM